MAHFGFMTLNVMGHLYPMSALASCLKSRGHRVTFFQFADAKDFLMDAGMDCVVFGRDKFPSGYTKQAIDALGKMKGAKGFRYTIELLCNEIETQLNELPDAVREEGIDALVIDQFLIGGSTVAEHLRLPYVHVANALMGNMEVDVPPLNFGWGNENGPVAGVRNRLGHAVVRRIFIPVRKRVNAQRSVWGLAPYREFMNERFGSAPQISQELKSFEFPRHQLPPTFYFVGPLHDGVSRTKVEFPWERLDGRPLVYASMGTLQTGLDWIFRAIVEGCADLNLQLILSTGGGDPKPFELSANAIVVRYAPQLELLQRASLCITHAGLNTVLESLAQGVPMVAIPITNDQPAVAARIAWTGTGKVIPLKKLTSEWLRTVVQEVIRGPQYRSNARKFQTEIKEMMPLVRACEIVESVCSKD
jgi:zeaxanthin glucosyltransferase